MSKQIRNDIDIMTSLECEMCDKYQPLTSFCFEGVKTWGETTLHILLERLEYNIPVLQEMKREFRFSMERIIRIDIALEHLLILKRLAIKRLHMLAVKNEDYWRL